MDPPPKVVLVDDEPAILESTRQLLSELGHDVICVKDARAILPTLLDVRPDLLIQDVRMPGLVVEDLVEAIRREPSLQGLRILLFSAGMDLEEVAARVGAAHHLEKPFKPSELATAIEGALG